MGSYPILQGTLTAGANYELTFVGASLSITSPGGGELELAVTLPDVLNPAFRAEFAAYRDQIATPGGASIPFTFTSLGGLTVVGYESPFRRRVNQCTPRSTAAASVHDQGGASGTTWRSALTTAGFGKGRERSSFAQRKLPPVADARARRRSAAD